MDFKIFGGSENAVITIKKVLECDGVTYSKIAMKLDNKKIPEKFSVSWKMPLEDCYSIWSPQHSGREMRPNWSKVKTESALVHQMPLQSVLSLDGNNRLTVALSDAFSPIVVGMGVCEEDACMDCKIDFFVKPIAPVEEYSVILRCDMRDIPFYEAVEDVVKWWETECGYVPASVPDSARMPMNSLWYSYHQMLDTEDIIKECKLSKPLGMDTVIIDDGWQTDDNARGYAYCGDWEVAESKMGDMKAFIDRIHETGMKAMVWYSVPYVGIKSKNYDRFKDMLLDGAGDDVTRVFDPRYKEVRDFLVETYRNAVSNWGLDGLKLDFIDAFELGGKSLEYDERRDYQSLEDAIDALMVSITAELTKINPEIMIEFRQTYVGPAIRKYGNMLRVTDCPNDARSNRRGIADLRLTSGNSAVHSDMLMWNMTDTPENVAVQLASVLYGVPQISVLIDKLSDEHKAVLAFYLDFWRKNREILLDGKLSVKNPESSYSSISAVKGDEEIETLYLNIPVTCRENVKKTVVNAAGNGDIIVRNAKGRKYKTVDCMGITVAEGSFKSEIEAVSVPMGGMIYIF